MTEYTAGTMKRMVKAVCERPGITARQIANACNLDHKRCVETLQDYGETLGLEMDPRSKRFYPKGACGVKRNTKSGKSKVETLSQDCLNNLSKILQEISDRQAAENHRKEQYLKRIAQQAEDRKAAWEEKQELIAQRKKLLNQKLEQQRIEINKEVEHFEKLESIKTMDIENLSSKITDAEFTYEPEDIQLAMSNQLLKKLDSTNEHQSRKKQLNQNHATQPSKASKISTPYRKISVIILITIGVGFTIFGLGNFITESEQKNLERKEQALIIQRAEEQQKAERDSERQRLEQQREAEYQASLMKRRRAGEAMRAAGFWLGPGGGCLTWNSKGNKKYVARSTCERFFEAEGINL